jgi:hypothetical protein
VSAVKLFMIGYFVGAAVFAAALVIILLRALSATTLNPTVPLVGGFILMFGSKFAGRAAFRRAGHR